MGDLGEDTAVEAQGEGRFTAVLSRDWEIWGPMGGYVAAIALRAAGASVDHPRPVALSCHYLGAGRFEPVDIRVELRRQGRTATSQRVEVTQEGRPILDAMVWSAAEVEGLEHDETTPPDVPGPDELPSIQELLPDDAPGPPFPFWENFDGKPLQFEADWPPDGPRPATWREWLRFLPTATFEDPWVDAARSVILVDLPSWPSAHRPHAWRQPPFMAPTLDLNVAFHRPAAGHEWLLCDGAAPLSTDGLFGWTARVWSPGGARSRRAGASASTGASGKGHDEPGHLAQLDVGRLRAPLDEPRIDDLEIVNPTVWESVEAAAPILCLWWIPEGTIPRWRTPPPEAAVKGQHAVELLQIDLEVRPDR